MTNKEVHKKAGSLSSYSGYIIILFFWYLLNNVYTAMEPVFPDTSIDQILYWGSALLIAPFVYAGVFGGIHEQQQLKDDFGGSRFFSGVKFHFWRIMGANLFFIVSVLIITIIAFLAGGYELTNIEDNKLALAVTSIPVAAIKIFCFSAIVVERKMFRGMFRAVKTLLFNPVALAIGILWGVAGYADTLIFDFQTGQIPLVINGVRAGVLATIKILAIMYTLAFYKKVWGNTVVDEPDELSPVSSVTTSGDKVVKASFGFAFVSFLPFFHLVALILGVIAMKRKQRFVWRAAIACCAGGFFSILYLLLLTSLFLAKPVTSYAPGYQFLAEVNSDLEPYVLLLENGEVQEFQQHLEADFTNNPEQQWVFDCALALAKIQEYDIEGALQDFRMAAEKNPGRSEFYYYYGLALLENGQEGVAVKQFKNALVYEPELEIAERYVTLIETAYKPSLFISSLVFVIILLMLFTLHEYGHAFAAWKLGDDTAKNQGRLTLNPIPHLDIFGSVLLPALLLWQQSEVIFGWAKPVPVNTANFKDPHKDHMRVSFAGPAVNLIVSMVCMVILGLILLFVRILWPETLSLNLSAPFSSVSMVGPPFAGWIVFVIVFLKQLFYTSLVLGCFNLIPVPPLDGSWIFAGLIPQRLRDILEEARRFSFVLFLLLVLTPALDYFLSIPIGLAWGGLQLFVLAMGFA